MTYRVLLRNNPTNGYTATALAWPECVVQAPTREEALAGIESAIRELLNTSEIVEVDVPETPVTEQMTQHKGFGMFRHDPTFVEFVKEVDAYHDERNYISRHFSGYSRR
ncbi:MAG: hypothetical protein R3E79_07735 [Caldilineaceae bacterium]